jgi:hypothetical protein
MYAAGELPLSTARMRAHRWLSSRFYVYDSYLTEYRKWAKVHAWV